MELARIEKLVEKYIEAETSLEEEKIFERLFLLKMKCQIIC